MFSIVVTLLLTLSTGEVVSAATFPDVTTCRLQGPAIMAAFNRINKFQRYAASMKCVEEQK